MSSRRYRAVKRATDVVVSMLVLVASAPLLALISAAIKVHDRGPVLFRQPRAGLHGRPFHVLKFRTMDVVTLDGSSLDTSTWTSGVPDDFVFKTPETARGRITPVGRWLRRTSLDELPQLVNVLLGQMSLVGPRPEILPIAERYSAEQAVRLSVKPGLTGWAQVTGRSKHDHGQKVAADRHYVQNASTWLDVKILVRTVVVALRGREAF